MKRKEKLLRLISACRKHTAHTHIEKYFINKRTKEVNAEEMKGKIFCLL